MFKLVFLFVVLAAVAAVIAANPHPHKKASGLQKHPIHHGLDSHGRPAATRVARSHKAHAPVHHGPAGSAHHSNKVVGGKHPAAGGNKGAVHRPVKHRGHRK